MMVTVAAPARGRAQRLSSFHARSTARYEASTSVQPFSGAIPLHFTPFYFHFPPLLAYFTPLSPLFFSTFPSGWLYFTLCFSPAQHHGGRLRRTMRRRAALHILRCVLPHFAPITGLFLPNFASFYVMFWQTTGRAREARSAATSETALWDSTASSTSIILNTKFIILNTNFILFSTEFIISNDKNHRCLTQASSICVGRCRGRGSTTNTTRSRWMAAAAAVSQVVLTQHASAIIVTHSLTTAPVGIIWCRAARTRRLRTLRCKQTRPNCRFCFY